jgi:co-chaperonin GroES (HSP10)
MNKITPPTPPKEFTTEEMLTWFNENFQALRDSVIIKLATEKEIEELSKTSNGIIKSLNIKSSEEHPYTVLAVGDGISNIKAGERIIIGLGNITHFQINKMTVGQILQYQIMGKLKK